MNLYDDIKYLKGVGPKMADYLHKLGIWNVYDLLAYFPRTYEDKSVLTPIAKLRVGEKETVAGVIEGVEEKTGGRRGLSILTATINDGTGVLQVTWFNQKFLKAKLKPGKKLFVTGKSTYAYGGRGAFSMSQLSSYEVLDSTDDVADELGIMPIYSTTAQVSQTYLQKITHQLFTVSEDDEGIFAQIPEVLEDGVIEKYRLMGRKEAFFYVHYPRNKEDIVQARRRLAFEELYLIQCGLLFLKKSTQEAKTGICHKHNGALIKKIMEALPFALTNDQKRAWNEIAGDMEKAIPMRRLVQGDVGSGKTVIALLALMKTVENGYQGALMAPTEILANQHYESFSVFLKDMGVRVELLSGKLTKKKREVIYEKLSNHEIDIIIGTHALIQEGVHFKSLGLVVTDEQHRFGISQRSELEKKGELMPDVLAMTATPIPRTMTLTVYGDLDVSIIRELPPGRKPVRTFVRTSDRRELIYKFMLDEINKGRQGYVVCPLIEMKEDIDLPSAEEIFQELSTGIFRNVPCALIHGKLKTKEKDAIMDSFHRGEIKLLVSTTVIEVGVNVPNASMMVIENAERFGLSQLHQLRGRIGRGEYSSYCVLVSSGRTDDAKERMRIMETTSDGFTLAEEDLKLRGPGQFFGTLQHGIPDLKIADVVKDVVMILKAREAAGEAIKNTELLKNIIFTLKLQYKNHFYNIAVG